MGTVSSDAHREPWNKGKLVGQKVAIKLKEAWALRVRLQMEDRVRELDVFNHGIDSKLRGCDLVDLRVRDVRRAAGDREDPGPPGLGCSTAAQGPGARAARRRHRPRRPCLSRSPASPTSASSQLPQPSADPAWSLCTVLLRAFEIPMRAAPAVVQVLRRICNGEVLVKLASRYGLSS